MIDLSKYGFTQIPHEVIRSRKIGKNPKLVLFAVMSHANAEGEAFPAQTTLADELGMKPSTVHAALEWLHDNGFLTFDPPGRRRSYTIHLEPRLMGMMRKKNAAPNLLGDDGRYASTLGDAVRRSTADRLARELAA